MELVKISRRRRLYGLCLSMILCIGLFLDVQAEEPEIAERLYAQSAVLMDADSGRILFEKNGAKERAMASTTKIMTCILALENGKTDDVVTASANAAAQPRVHLGVTAGEQFLLKELLYSLMLESHNDAAVMIAEHISGSVEAFADLMNAKAEELGLSHTYFITPNGLDASDDRGTHHTTAEELAVIMKYCIMDSEKAEEFLEITGTPSFQFTDQKGVHTYSCTNHNRFLTMMEGVISGKTGFTGEAGYCYVGALQKDGRTFIVALLGCGWPNHKNYKWEDTRLLMEYGLENYQYRDIWSKQELPEILVEEGVSEENPFERKAWETLSLKTDMVEYQVLLADWEKTEIQTELPETLEAPVKAGDIVGWIRYELDDKILLEIPVIAQKNVPKINFKWFFTQIIAKYLC